MATIRYTFPVLTPLEQTCTQLDHVGIARFCAANGVSERVACAAYNRACDKRRDIGLWHARERDGKPHSFTTTP
jgi:hypothetical protein